MADLHQPHSHPADATHDAGTHHEESDVNISGIFAFGVVLTFVTIVIYLVVGVLFKYLDTREARQETLEYPLAATQGNRLPPEPRLQTNPRQDLADLRAREEQALTGYSWVDRNAGIVRIPIDEAIRKTLERGLPARAGQRK
ncbi:MAG TPA: hypothetical protein VKE96_02700 [Vicinamibacterales bacterium]|nr:hypothetical protein [Vicinamibacterales bacterium]